MSQVRLACEPLFCQNSKEIRSNLSVGLRITAVVSGILAGIVGVLILFSIPGFAHFGAIGGWASVSLGTFLVLVGIAIKCVKAPEKKSQFESLQLTEKREQKDTLESSDPTTKETDKVKLTTAQEQILSDFTPQMVDALGGVDAVLALPEIKDWNGLTNLKVMQAPVMKGYKEGLPFLLFCYFRYSLEKEKYETTIEYLGRRKEGSWVSFSDKPYELNLRCLSPILDHSLAAEHMLDKIARLMKGEPIGVVEEFPGVAARKPSDRDIWRPKDAYLEGEKLEQFMDLNTLCYERKPREGTSELFLYDPRISWSENIRLYRQKYSNRTVRKPPSQSTTLD